MFLSPVEAHEDFVNKSIEGIKSHFPIKGQRQTLHLDEVEVKDELDHNDIRTQQAAKTDGKSFAVPVYGKFRLVDNETGKVVDQKKVRMAELPKMTNRYSYIMDGQEYQMDNQWQLKPGAYTRRRQNGELETRFNIKGASSFDMLLDPETKEIRMEYNKAKLPMYPLMKAMGVDDEQIKKTLGEEIYNANKSARGAATTLEKFYKSDKRVDAPSRKAAEKHFYETMVNSKMRPETNAITLGKPIDHVSGEAMLLAAGKLLKVQGGHPEDDRDSLVFKDLRSGGDFVYDKMRAASKAISNKAFRQINHADKVTDVVTFDLFNEPVKQAFYKNSAARTATQINPVEMISASTQTTIMGPGGIQSERSITDEAKFVNPSHLGYIDPIHTPEGCFDVLTEVLTRSGWKFWPDVTASDEFACRVDDRLEFHPPTALVDAHYEGPMYGVDTKKAKRRLDYLVTPNHRLFVRPIAKPGASTYRIETADQVHNNPRMVTSCHLPALGQEALELFPLPSVPGNNSSINVAGYHPSLWAEFLGWFVSEGNLHYSKQDADYKINIHQSEVANPDNCARIKRMFEAMGIKHCTTYRENGRNVYSVCRKQIAHALKDQGTQEKRFLPEYVFDFPLNARRVLFETMLAGDGRINSQPSKGNSYKQQVYCTTSHELAQGFERLAISLGYCASTKTYRDERQETFLPVHEVRVFQHPERQIHPKKGHYYTQQYSGRIYCATVPGGLLYVRRNNGMPHWSGNSRTGVSLRIPFGVQKIGNTPHIPLYNLKTQKMEFVPPETMLSSKVVMPDQVTWKDGHPTPVSQDVKVAGKNNEMLNAKFADAQYVMRHPSYMFNITSNLIPYMGNTSGNRASMATRHIEQSISLLHREAPLVQVSTGVDEQGLKSFENILGSQASHQASHTGTIHEIKPDGVIIKTPKGELHEVQLYNNYPVNDAKSVLHSTPLVKVGDSVKQGQTIADTNYSRNGVLALGTNLRVGYVPFKGYNFEDGVVISDKAAEKLSSVHMYKHQLPLDDNTKVNKKTFLNQQFTAFKSAQLAHVGDDGVARVGSIINPGDPLILAHRSYDLKDKAENSAMAIRRSIANTQNDVSLKWDGSAPGEVVKVTRDKDGIQVHVRTVEKMQVGDKLCFDEATEVLTRRGWKKVAAVTLADQVCCLVDGNIVYQEPTHLHAYEAGGRMYRIESQQVDLLVTENHQMYVAPRSRHPSHRLLPAKELFGREMSYAKAGTWVGETREFFTFPALEVKAGQFGHGVRTIPELRLRMETFLLLLGAFLSEGSVIDQPSSGSYGIAIAQKPGPSHDLLTAALREAGIDYSLGGLEDKVVVYSKQLLQYFRQFGHAPDKYIPDDLFELPPEQLQVLFRWLMWGDGHTKKLPIAYSTTSPRLADDVQRLLLHLGMAGNVKLRKEAGPQVIRGKTYDCQNLYDVRIINKKLTPTVNHSHVKEQGGQQEFFIENYERPVYCVTVPGHVLYVRRNGKPVWSGNSGRHGNKGIVAAILPDHEMPHTRDGKPIEVALNPSGVPGRMNIGQVLETAMSKVADKTGKPIVASSFGHDSNMLGQVQAALKAHNISDTEELIDPTTGQSIGHALVGKQHILKLVHQVDKKVGVSSGMSSPNNPSTYDQNLQPSKGQRVDALATYALLAHGAKANLREMNTFKGEGSDDPSKPLGKRWQTQHAEVWAAIQTGSPIPTPKTTFAYRKFTDLLKGSGINIEKHGHELMLSPLTDKHILEMSEGRELPKAAERLSARADNKTGELIPRPGGLFDEKLTGGPGGLKWSHIKLAEPLPNPVFEKPIRALTGLSQKDYDSIVAGTHGISNGNVVPVDKANLTGGHAIKSLLKQIDVKSELAASKKALYKAKPADVDNLLKKIKYLRSLDQLGMKPEEAYVLHHVPILPPMMRPASVMADGNVKYADINQLYAELAQVNDKLKDPTLAKNLTPAAKADMRSSLYEGLRSVTGFGIPYADAKHKGLLHQVGGSNPKESFFQKVLTQKRQDLSMRSTIVPEPALGLDQVGLPKEHAMELFRPFLVKKLQDMGGAPSPLDAQKLIDKSPNSTLVHDALAKVMAERPVLLKRDPALHKYSVQGFQPVITDGNSIKIHPLVCGGFNADFDGDTMSVFVPVHKDAVAEAHRMKPSNNLFMESTGKIAYTPTLESALGIYKLSVVGKDSGKSFKSLGEAMSAAHKGELKITDKIEVDGKSTTAGRILLSTALPEAMQHDVLYGLDKTLGNKGLNQLLTKLGKDHKDSFGDSVNKLKDLGNHTSYGSVAIPLPGNEVNNIKDPKKNRYIKTDTHTLALKDFEPDVAMRESVLTPAHAQVANIKKMGLNKPEEDRRVIEVYTNASAKMKKLHEESESKDPSNLFQMYQAGVKPGWSQYKQMVIAPMLYEDSAGRTIPMPVTKSYSEGLDTASYWTQMHGARKGAAMKVQEVSEPGYMSKLMMNNMMDIMVNGHDCGTKKGVLMSVTSPDIHDRVLAVDYKGPKGQLIPAGTIVNPSITGMLGGQDKNTKLLVRSPLKCEHADGICQKCSGLSSDGHLHDVGTNVGVMAAHSVGERAVQLTMKQFHGGGVAGSGSGVTNSFARFQQLTMLPKTIPNAAAMSNTNGKVEKIEHSSTGVNITIGGQSHFVGKDVAGNALHQPLGADSEWKGIHVGMEMKAGDFLSDPGRTVRNPHDLYKATKSIDKVQQMMTEEIHSLYKDEGVKRQHVELLVKAMSNLTKVVHPGDSDQLHQGQGILRGEFHPLSHIERLNADLIKAGKAPVEHTPVLKGMEMTPLSLREDWLAKMQHQRLRTTLSEAAAFGSTSNIHGDHPVPGLAYGAEFGMNETHSLQPGLGHLKDVKKYKY